MYGKSVEDPKTRTDGKVQYATNDLTSKFASMSTILEEILFAIVDDGNRLNREGDKHGKVNLGQSLDEERDGEHGNFDGGPRGVNYETRVVRRNDNHHGYERTVFKSKIGDRCSTDENSSTLASQGGRPSSSRLTHPSSSTTTSTSKSSGSGGERLKESLPYPYAKPRCLKCFTCGEPGDKSNVCPKRATYYVGQEDKQCMFIYEALQEDGLEYTEPVEGEAEQVTYVIQRTLCSPKVSDSFQGLAFMINSPMVVEGSVVPRRIINI
nr:hypothetical protein [Tanacetum cinerariifolium]